MKRDTIEETLGKTLTICFTHYRFVVLFLEKKNYFLNSFGYVPHDLKDCEG